MKIVMVAGHACVRVQKMAIPLIERGHEVHLVSFKKPPAWEQYKTFIQCADVEQMIGALKLHAQTKVDVFHAHNEPSYFVTLLKEITDRPVILDVHDSYLTRSTPDEATKKMNNGETHIRITTEERNNFQLADALVFPGDDFRAAVTSEFGLEQPALTLPSYVPERFYRYHTRDWHGGVAYEGKVNLPSETKAGNTGFEYCEYTEMGKRASEIGMDFHLYSGRDDKEFLEHYKGSSHVFVHKPLAYEELLNSIGRHDWGLVGNVAKWREWEVAMPNKFFEYICASLPVVSMNSATCSKFAVENGLGIEVGSPEELADRWKEHRDVRKTLVKERKRWSMNAHIHELEAFYRAIS